MAIVNDPNKNYPPITPDTYRVTLPVGDFTFVSAHTIFPYLSDRPIFPGNYAVNNFIQEIYEDTNTFPVWSNKYSITLRAATSNVEYAGQDIGHTINLVSGVTYKVVYIYQLDSSGNITPFTNRVTYTFSVVENKRPLKPWSITDVINRLLDLCEPIRKGEKPRFRLNGMDAIGGIIPEGQDGSGQAAKFDKIQAPQFALTRQTLRECLQEVGKVIHGEPRLRIKKGPTKSYLFFRTEQFDNGEVMVSSGATPDPYERYKQYYVLVNGLYKEARIVYGADPSSPADDVWWLAIDGSTYSGNAEVYTLEEGNKQYYYEVYYDLYSSQEGDNIQFMPYTSKGTEWIINNYQAWIDSNAEHLVNQLDKYGGVVIEPYSNGAKTVRTENQYVRITDDNMIIATQYPIYTVDKLEYVYAENGATKAVDITAYVFEKSEYDTRLSSYQSQYPYSKAYGLYFSQGSKNIGGLNFKVEAARSLVFNNYAIINILRQVTGNSKLFDYKPLDKNAQENYPKLAFRVTYTPIYDVRVAQTKTNYKDFKYPAALIYNQQSNIIESRYYGENLKGVAARLGNVEKSFTYCLKWLRSVPRAGMMFRKDYYISAVAVEILPTYIRCTVGISKDFNRISAYIGVPSEKRYYEISEQQAVDRNVLYREYIVIGDPETPDTDCLIGDNMMRCIAGTFTNGNAQSLPITNVYAWGTSYGGNQLPAVQLPVISSAFGNSISFSWRYENNYSAGAVSQKIDKSATVSGQGITGFWQNDARYTDYYGRIFYYNFELTPYGGGYNERESLLLPQSAVPTEKQLYVSTAGKTPYILRKDNREALQVNFQIDFVTNTDIIIGSALASSCPAVRTDKVGNPRLYVFPTELNKFTDHIEAWEDVDLSSMPYVEVTTTVRNNQFTVNAPNFPASGKSWAIVTPQSQLPVEEVEDEFGNVSSSRQTVGGDLLIGQNIDVSAGQVFTPVYFTKKRKIFDESVWVDIK